MTSLALPRPQWLRKLIRSKTGRIALALIILNELRGLTVVALILWSWWK